MDDTSGFFKKLNGEITRAPNFVYSPTATLLREEKDTYTYPVDGWYWFDSLDAAIVFFATPATSEYPPFPVTPEGYELATTPYDENEFNKLLGLLKLNIDLGKITLSTPIKIKDASGVSHIITVERFLDVISEYGMYCYTLRNY